MLNQSELKAEKGHKAASGVARRVGAALGVQPNEGLPLMLLFAQSFFMGLMLISFYTAANALFLLEFSAQEIPLVYIVSAGVITFAGWSFSTLEKRISFPILLMGTCVFFLLSILALRLGLWLTEASWLAFALMVWLRLLWVLGNLVIWTLAGRLFDVRQSKRLFTLVGAGAVLGIISTGLFVPLLIGLIGTVNLLFVTAIGQVGGLLFLQIALRRFHDRLTNPSEKKEERQTEGGGLASLPKSRYVFLIFLYSFLSILATYLMDYVFIKEAEARYTDIDLLARFFGNYLTINTSVSLLVSLVAGSILSRYGVKAGLLINPMVVMICVLITITTSILLGPISALFWLLVATKLLDEVLGVGITSTSLRILYQPLPSQHQFSMQVAVESVLNPLSVGLVGVLLLLFNAFGHVTTIGAMYLLLFLLACWIAAGFVLNREYIVALKQALTKRHLGDGSLVTTPGLADGPLVLTRIDRSTIDLLKQSLTSRHVGGVIYALDMLEENEPDLLPSLLPEVFRHHAPEVRVDVLRRIERLRLTSLLPTIKTHIKEQDGPHEEGIASVEGASLRVLAALSDTQALQDIYPYLESPVPEVRQGTMIGLLRSGKIEAILAAGQTLLQMVSSGDAAERSLAAQVLGEGGIPFVAPLLTLLEDDDIQVQRAALSAASTVKHAQLWPVVITRLAEPKVRRLAVTALVAGGEAVLTPLKSAFQEEASRLSKQQQGAQVLIQLAKICGRLGGPNVMAFLEQQLDFPDEQVRFHILAALNQSGYQSQDEERILEAIKADIAHLCWILAVVRDLADQEPLISSALTSQMATYRTRLFLWLSFIYDPALIQQLENTLRVDYAQKKAYVFEIMQTVLSNDLFALLLPLLDDDASALQQLKQHFPQPKQDHKQRLHELISVPNKRLDAWTRTCALYRVAGGEVRDEIDKDIVQAVINMLSAPEPLLRESAAWSIAKLDPANALHYLEPLRHDPHPSVAKTVNYLTQSATQGEAIMLSMVEKVIALKSSTFFAKTKENILADVAAILEEVELNAEEILFKKGELGDCMYIVHSGQLRLHDGERTFEQAKAGGAFGELALLAPAPRSAQATAITDALLLRLDAAPFYELIADHSDVARSIMEVLVRRLRRW